METISPTRSQATPKSSSFTPLSKGLLLRKCACGGSAGLTGECASCQKEKLTLQRKASNQEEVSKVPPIVHEVLNSPGQSLDPETRTFMESRFNEDLSQVKIHTDEKAAESARAVSAKAYTVRQDIVFNLGEYAPQTKSGQQLLAHELTHVVQQRYVPMSTALQIGSPNDAAEQEADRFANQVMQQSNPDTMPRTFSDSIHDFTPVLRQQGDTLESKPDAREIKLRQLATRPRLALQQWRSLSQNDRDRVLWNMTLLYDPPFTSEFLKYARGLKKPNLSGGVLKGFEYTSKWLFDRGYRHAYGELWVHPSGEEITFLGSRTTKPDQPPPPEPTEPENDCENNCFEDTENEDECRSCCEETFPETDSNCRKYCDSRCNDKL